MRHEVVLVEQLGACRRFRDQPLSLTNVPFNDVADVGIELLTCQLQTFICLQLLLSQLGESVDLQSSKLHVLPFALSVTLLLSRFRIKIGLICLIANHIQLNLPCFISSFLKLLGQRNRLL